MPHLFVNDLTVIDCSLLHNSRGLIGASWIVDIELFGELDEQSMVFDFGLVKKRVKTLIDEYVDHKLLVPTSYTGLEITPNNPNSLIEFTDEKQQVILHDSPDDALCKIETELINRQSVTDFLLELIRPQLPDNVTDLKITLRQEDDYAFFYHYSHGLKKHDGNCQRIAHGHRSRIQVWENEKRSRTWEQYWATTFEDIYIGTKEDVASINDKRTRFEYQAPQGKFMIELDNKRVHIMEYDSTVECIAQYIAEQTHKQHPDSTIKVKAFEGVKKGAIAIVG